MKVGRIWGSGGVALAIATAGCQAGGTGAVDPTKARPAVVLAKSASLIGLDGASLIGLDGASLIGQDAAGVVSHDGAGISGSVRAPSALIGNDAAGVVSNDGAGLVGQDAAGMVGKVKRQLTAVSQAPLAGVRVYLRTADGKYVTGADGKLLVALCDAKGLYRFPRITTEHNLVAVAALRAVANELQALQAVVPRGAVTVELDLASTLATSYMLAKYIQPADDRTASFDRLTAQAAQDAAESTARAVGDVVPAGIAGLGSVAIVAAVEGLRKTAPELDAAMVRVQALVVVGKDRTTAVATGSAVTLYSPISMGKDAEGNLYIAEQIPGIIRKIAVDGTNTVFVGPGSTTHKDRFFLSVADLVVGEDGIYFAAPFENQVWRLSLDGETLEEVVGKNIGLRSPSSLAFEANGSLLIGEARSSGELPGRVLRRTLDGDVKEVMPSFAKRPGSDNNTAGTGIAVADGVIWVLDHRARGRVFRLVPDSAAWDEVAIGGDFRATAASRIVALPDGGGVLITETDRNRITWLDATGKVMPYAAEPGEGDGDTLATARFSRPSGLTRLHDGTILVADRGSVRVRAIKPDGRVQTLAGVALTGPRNVSSGIDLNIPLALAIDPEGRLVITEYGTSALLRLDGDVVTRLSGGSAGYTGDGGPVEKATFANPTGIAYRGRELIVADQQNHAVRLVSAEGIVSTLVGPGPGTKVIQAEPMAVGAAEFVQPASVLAGPDGTVYVADRDFIYRIGTNGIVDRIVGGGPGGAGGLEPDGTPGIKIGVLGALGLAFDPHGDLVFSDGGNFVLRRVALKEDGMPTYRVAGCGQQQTLLNLLDESAASEADVADAKDATLLVAMGLAYGPDGTLYVAEGGTTVLDSVARSGGIVDFPFDLPKLAGRIRAIAPDGRTRTLAGTGAPSGTPVVGAPTGLVFDRQGRLVFADMVSSQVKALALSPR